jgi:DEAD/DEAH box helicase domain-containing protein
MRSFVGQLAEHRGLGAKIAHHRRIPGAPAQFGAPRVPLPVELVRALEGQGISRLYTHQAEALEIARAGDNVLAVTPTASGKTLVFALPVLEGLFRDPRSRALFLYPTKALAQDQVGGLRELALSMSPLRPPRVEIYDGDTPSSTRRKIKADPPEILITNPDMLHMGILAHHHDWAAFLRELRFIVLDELHVYRGVFGAHVHHILQRLRRVCSRLGASPRYVAASATIGNPGEFAATLTGEPFRVVDRSGAPRAAREVLLINPIGVSPYTTAVRVVAEAARSGYRTIAFTKARRITELLYTWLVQQAPELAGRVAPYRAGYLPEQRREIEARLFRGDLRAVLTTSALELGIDVGGLDVCVLVGYPGSLSSTWQRIGRVGRQDRDALVVLIAMPDALDQYLVAHPEEFFGGKFERAVLDPWNEIVSGQHLVCAAAEEPLMREELAAAGARAERVAAQLVEDGRLTLDADGRRWFSFRRRPHRDVYPRSAGEPFAILDAESGRTLGTVDGMRVYHECHPEAIYLHAGRSYRVIELDADARRVRVQPARVDYYTVVLGEKETEILETLEQRRVGSHPVGYGRLKVTVRIRGYQKKRLFGGEPISEHSLDAPPLIFETTGLWIELPVALRGALTAEGLHFMGGIHATEHAAIGLFPLLAISDRGDVGGISYTGHPQVGGPAIFLYDGIPGGAGLAAQAFRDLEQLLRKTLDHVSACSCDDGCPACIQSPKCGNGNKPLDKAAAVRVLRIVLGDEQLPAEAPVQECAVARDLVLGAPGAAAERTLGLDAGGAWRRHGITRALPEERVAPLRAAIPPPTVAVDRVMVLDLETQRGAADVGGWGNIREMGLALAVAYDVRREAYRTYFEADVDRLLLDLVMADRVVGFNIDRFDLAVLSGYTEWDLSRIRTLDLLAAIHDRIGFRVSLRHLAEVNLGESKAADGLQSLAWWKQGRIDLIEHYCRKDVEVTRRLYDLGRHQGYLLYRHRDGERVRVPVGW